jgi:hypothetical protein
MPTAIKKHLGQPEPSAGQGRQLWDKALVLAWPLQKQQLLGRCAGGFKGLLWLEQLGMLRGRWKQTEGK